MESQSNTFFCSCFRTRTACFTIEHWSFCGTVASQREQQDYNHAVVTDWRQCVTYSPFHLHVPAGGPVTGKEVTSADKIILLHTHARVRAPVSSSLMRLFSRTRDYFSQCVASCTKRHVWCHCGTFCMFYGSFIINSLEKHVQTEKKFISNRQTGTHRRLWKIPKY